MLVLKNARLIPQLTEDYDGNYADVILDGERIQGIYPVGSLFRDCESLDLNGKTLLPGLIDLHVHLHFNSMDFDALSRKKPYENVVNGMEYAEELLRQGFTTVRTCGDPHGTGFAVKEAVQRGVVKGPRILTCGMYISPTARGVD